MFNLIPVLLIGLLNLPKTAPCVAQYGQCGGAQYTGETDCCAPSTCQYNNAWYSQCIPSSAPSNTGCNAVWSQCGGQNWSGSTCCINSDCIYSNPYYSQCLPPSSSSSSFSSTGQTTSSSATKGTSSTGSSTTTAASTSSSSTTSTNQGCSAVWNQCGGIGWNGPTTCCTGLTCTFGNAYYSQCLLSGGSFTITSTASSSDSGSGTGSSTISSGNINQQSGVTTRYWDCCKPSCAWSGKASVTNPVQTCAQDGVTPVNDNTQSVCTGGSAYTCNNQQPWNVSSTLSYGYAAAYISGEDESDWCCACYSLIFTSGSIVGKELIVQVTNTGGDLGNNQFDLAIPGGGFGIYDGCTSEFGGSYSWGATYGGVSQRSDCANLPPVLQSGCYWRFDWFEGADNPTISFTQVTCPSALTANTQCVRV